MFGSIAQLAEQPTFNRKRGGSLPSGPTMVHETSFFPHFQVEILEPKTEWQKWWSKTHYTIRYLDDGRVRLLPKDCVRVKKEQQHPEKRMIDPE